MSFKKEFESRKVNGQLFFKIVSKFIQNIALK